MTLPDALTQLRAQDTVTEGDVLIAALRCGVNVDELKEMIDVRT